MNWQSINVFIIQQKSFEFLALITQLMYIWLKHSTQNIQKYMQIWRILMSPLEASTNCPGHVIAYFRTSMSEARPPQGPDMWYLTFYQNKVLTYQAIVTNSLSFKILCTKLWSKTEGGWLPSGWHARYLVGFFTVSFRSIVWVHNTINFCLHLVLALLEHHFSTF